MTCAAPPAIVEGSVADLDTVMTVMTTGFDPRFGEAWTRAQCAGMLGLPAVWLLVARAAPDGETIGFALARVVLDEAELLLLAVRPDARRRGVGAALLRAIADGARTRGATRMHLEMRAGNDAAILYTAHGFREVGRRHRYYMGRDGERFDAITLSSALA